MIDVKGLYPPVIVDFPTGGRYAISGSNWIPVSAHTTMNDISWKPLYKKTKVSTTVLRTWTFEASEKSKKAGFKKWIVKLIGEKLVCDCGGYQWTRNCKHVKQVRKENSK